MDASAGAVIGLFGPWGAGKTSVLNMVREALGESPALVTVSFEPWLFSGTSELLSLFFGELARQLGEKKDAGLDRTVRLLQTYGEVLDVVGAVPVVGSFAWPLGALGRLFGNSARRRLEKGRELPAVRERLTTELAERERPLVVMLDDIDRLQPQEIHDILRLVRLTGQFPQVIYLLAMDRQRVETVLVRDGFEGRDYLEKIIEVAHDLSAVSGRALRDLLLEDLEALLGALGDLGPFDEVRWSDVFRCTVWPLLATARDIRRYLAVLPVTLASIGPEVALVDVLALEALRVLQPDAHTALAAIADTLTTPQPRQDGTDHKARVQTLLDAVPENDSVARAAVQEMCRLLFPAAEQYLPRGRRYSAGAAASWRKEHRVAHRIVLDIYLGRVLDPEVVPAAQFARVVAALGDSVALQAEFDQLQQPAIEDVLERLEAYERDYPLEAVKPALSVLMRLYARMRPNRHLFDPGGDLRVDRVMARLLKRVGDPETLASTVERLTLAPGTLYGLMQLTVMVSHQPGAGRKLLPEQSAARFLDRTWATIRSAGAGTLLRDHRPLRLLYHALRAEGADRTSIDQQLDENPELVAALLRDAVDMPQSPQFGGAAVNQRPTLQWDQLLAVMGGRDQLQHRLATLRAQGGFLPTDQSAARAVALAEEHLRNPPTRTWPHPVTTSENSY